MGCDTVSHSHQKMHLCTNRLLRSWVKIDQSWRSWSLDGWISSDKISKIEGPIEKIDLIIKPPEPIETL